MRRKLPSTGALEAFEAAARHQSFTKAAEELSVTQSAVCRQVGALETFLDVRLFRRTRRGVCSPRPDWHYSRSVGARLDEVERDTLELMARGGAAFAELAVVPTFGTRWLLPRLPAFQRAHPHVVVHLSSRTRPFLFSGYPFRRRDPRRETGSARGARHRDALPDARGTESRVASPALVAQRPLGAADWARLPLLQQSTGRTRGASSSTASAWSCRQAMAGPRLELFSMLTEAARAGMGVALAPPFFVQEELAQGRLVNIAPRPVSGQRAYSLIYPEHKAELPALQGLFGMAAQGEASPNAVSVELVG